MKAKLTFFTLLSTFNFQLSTFSQGNLNPPGPPTNTFKTLQQIEPRAPISSLPFTIANPGAYYLTTNLTGSASANGITIQTNDVSIDLNGFALIGVASSLNGLTISGVVTNLAVYNGTLRNWGSAGVNWLNGDNCLLQGVRLENNGTYGVIVTGSAVVRDCVARGNRSLQGISVGGASLVSNCTSVTNNSGIATGSGSVIIGCASMQNTTFGILTSSGTSVQSCTARGNGGVGIEPSDGSSVTDCTASQNGSHGIWVINSGNGNGCIVKSCTATGNAANGILVDGANNLILDNVCSLNGPAASTNFAGINVTGGRNRIDGNALLANNNRGLKVSTASGGFTSFIVRNSASGNGVNYDIGANNSVGVIVVAPLSAAILGSSGGSGVGSSDPWANFSH